MARQFKPLRFFVLMGLLVFFGSGITAFYTHRAAHGRTSEERSAYSSGLETAKTAPAGATLPSAAALNTLAQEHFAREGRGEPMAWKLAFEHGYEDGFANAHPVH